MTVPGNSVFAPRSWGPTVGGLAALAGLAALPGPALAQSFTALGFLPNGSDSNAWVSADGSVVAGYCGTTEGHRAYRWTSSGGMVSLGVLPDDMFSFGYGVSGDGSVIVGYSGSIGGNDAAFRWTQAYGMQSIGVLPDAIHSYAQGVSTDGLVIVGDCRNFFSGIQQAFRWTADAGMVQLEPLVSPTFAAAYGVNADGSVIVGYSGSDIGDQAVRWVDGTPQGLGQLSGDDYAYAYGVNADGSVVVGYSGVGFIDDRAFRWTSADGMVSLGTLPGTAHTNAYACSADGNVVVGSAYGDTADSFRAFMWTPALGLVDLTTYLPTLGLDLTGWVLTSSAAVSADGTKISGLGRNNGRSEGWLADLGGGAPPCPGDVDGDNDVDLGDLATLLSNFGLDDATREQGDLDADGDVDLSDLATLLSNFGSAC